jgi:hypothetical protein
MKRGMLLVYVVLLLFIIPFGVFADNETSDDFDITQGFEWLHNEMLATNWGSEVDTLSWSILALRNGGYDVEPGIQKLNQLKDHSDNWDGDAYETAMAVLALHKSGENVDNEIEWLEVNQKQVLAGGEWLIQFLVDSDEEATCKIYYDDDSERTFTINESRIISPSDCNEGDNWVDFEACIKGGTAEEHEEFSVNCRNAQVETSLLFHSGSDYYIVDQNEPLEIENACFHGASERCRCQPTQYASWVLEEVGKHPYTFPYLKSNCNDEIVHNVFLYMLTGNNIYSSFLEGEKSGDGSWEGREETTALSVLALEESSVMISDSVEWLKFQQKRSDGSWNGNVKTTAMVLYTLTDELFTPYIPNNVSISCGNSIIDAGEECEFTSDCDETDAICTGCQCLSDPECEYSYECDAGEVCELGICVQEPGCTLDSDCDDNYVCESGECKWRGTPTEGCTYDFDCEEGQVCESGECISEGNGWVTWLIVALVLILGGVGGYFGYKQYFSKRKSKPPVGGRALPTRNSSLSAYPKSNQKVPTRAAAPRRAAGDPKGDRLERELDQSLKKAKDLLRKK